MNKRAAKLLQDLDIHADVTQTIDNYSIAIQQMIAIARAVDMSAKVIILDEPTSSLDDGEVEKLFKLMLRLKGEGVGIIFVTHFLEQVYAVCDKITVLRNGQLVGEFTTAELPRVQLVAKMILMIWLPSRKQRTKRNIQRKISLSRQWDWERKAISSHLTW